MNSKFLELTGMKVVTDGQTGVGIAGLRVAQSLGIRTGGLTQRNFNTDIGPQPSLKNTFKCEECSGGYSNRAKVNVLTSDSVLIITVNNELDNVTSAIEYSKYIGKPFKVIQLTSDGYLHPKYTYPEDTIEQVSEWLYEQMEGKEIYTLNVVGDSSKNSPGIFGSAFMLLVQIFHKVQLRVCEKHGVQLDDNIKHLASQLTNESAAQSLADNYQNVLELCPRL
jgi:hypothetical protein